MVIGLIYTVIFLLQRYQRASKYFVIDVAAISPFSIRFKKSVTDLSNSLATPGTDDDTRSFRCSGVMPSGSPAEPDGKDRIPFATCYQQHEVHHTETRTMD